MDVPPEAGLLCDKEAIIGTGIKETLCVKNYATLLT
jgi:hypothetical protein